jgi:hypothetical protein
MGLFGKKKQQQQQDPAPAAQPPAEPPVTAPPGPPSEFDRMEIMGIPPELVRAMLTDWANNHGGSFPATMSATLEINEHCQVSRIVQPVANGVPYIPSFPGMGWLNEVLEPFTRAPVNERAVSFTFTFDNGEMDASFGYAT